jgi:preprotein translocase subunit SecG
LYIALVTVYIIICFFLILVVLLQQGKGADIAGAFGGGSSQTAFGARGATTFLHKLTTFAFVGFVLISMLLSIIEARPKASVIDKALPAAAASQKPAVPAPAAPAPDGAAPAPAAAQPAPGNAAPPSSGGPAKP